MDRKRKLTEEIKADLESGETLVAATNADFRGEGGALVGFIFSGLASNLTSKMDDSPVDETTHLPHGPVVVAVTDRRVLFYKQDLDWKSNPPEFVIAVAPEGLTGAGKGKNPLTDTMHIDFADGTKLELSLENLNHASDVVKGIHKLLKS